MSRRHATDTLPFDTLRLEGSLFVPELLERASRGAATAQKEADYATPRGLKLHDEYGRAYRIAGALWQDFSAQRPRADLDAASVTRRFVIGFLRQTLGYDDLALLEEPITVADRGFPVTAAALGGRLPVIIASHSLGLDDPDPGFAIEGSGAKKKSAHQLAQEYLNAAPGSLWAIVSNGRSLRLLRDAETLTRANFLEFDLEAILGEGEDRRYADYSALWRILHASRAGEAGAAPAECIWEQWKGEGHAQGLRVREGLRNGVQQALLVLGSGFLRHPANDTLRQHLHDGSLTKEVYFEQLLRLIYRSLFLFCAEERELLHPPLPDDEAQSAAGLAARRAYATGYSVRRFRTRSLRQSAHDPHGDLWISLKIVFRSLAGGQEQLAMPALGGLFAETQCPDLDAATLSNRDLLSAMRELRWFFDKKSAKRSAIDYRNMGPEELGSVYESLLELVPTVDLSSRDFGFAGITDNASSSGNARKITGSYYTPDSLVQELIKSALEPVIRQRLADARELALLPWATLASRLEADPTRRAYVFAYLAKHAAVSAEAGPEGFGRAWDAIPAAARANPLCAEALLALTVCDPSCGSGHFLLAAARRLAERLAELRAPDGAVRPDDYRHALREVASRCLYGVDINPMAVELCRVALWLETVDPGRPLGFLNHHIRTGNSLLGTTPELIADGLPDDTFKAIEGDDKAACAELKKRNKKEREGFGPLFEKEENAIRAKLRQAATTIEAMDDSKTDALQKKETAFFANESAPEYRHAKLLADLWCAAFVIKKRYVGGDDSESPVANAPTRSATPVEGHLLHTQDELFGQPSASLVPKADRKSKLETSNLKLGIAVGITTGTLRDFVQGKALSADLQSEVEALARQYRFFHWHLAFPQVFDHGGFDCILGNPPWERVEKDSSTTEDRAVECTQKLLQYSGRFPICGAGRKNLYALFYEIVGSLVNSCGICGIIVQTSVLQDEPSSRLTEILMEKRRLKSVFEFENRRKNYDGAKWFHDADPSMRFVLLTIGSSDSDTTFVFDIDELHEIASTKKSYKQSAEEVRGFCDLNFRIPIFKLSADALIASIAHGNGELIGSLSRGASTKFKSGLIFNSEGNLKNLKRTFQENANYVKVFTGSSIHQYDHRFADSNNGITLNPTPSDKSSADFITRTMEYLPDEIVNERIQNLAGALPSWFVAMRRHAKGVNELVAISAIVPRAATESSLNAFFSSDNDRTFLIRLVANINTFAFNYLVKLRQAGFSLNKTLYECIPLATLKTGSDCRIPWISLHWLSERVLELTYTAWDLEPFAQDCDWPGPPFRWDEERRFLLRCELDAAFFHLYLGSEEEWTQQPEALTRAFPTPRDAVGYIMDTFPIVKRKDEAKHGSYRTKDAILQIYDALGGAIQTGQPYQTLLDPPPADPACCHPPRE